MCLLTNTLYECNKVSENLHSYTLYFVLSVVANWQQDTRLYWRRHHGWCYLDEANTGTWSLLLTKRGLYPTLFEGKLRMMMMTYTTVDIRVVHHTFGAWP